VDVWTLFVARVLFAWLAFSWMFKVFGVESVWWSRMVCNCMEMDGGGAMRFAGCRQSVRLD
jgi:endonuclease/exonuclease/phosphatase (EEP) superfamily protein YafD